MFRALDAWECLFCVQIPFRQSPKAEILPLSTKVTALLSYFRFLSGTMYLRSLNFCYCRCFSGTGCIFIYLPAPIADTFFHAHVSPVSFSLSLQILLNHLTMYNCIFIAWKITIADTRHQQMASSLPGKSPSQILVISKWHLHCPRSHHCRYFPTANGIFIARKITITDTSHYTILRLHTVPHTLRPMLLLHLVRHKASPTSLRLAPLVDLFPVQKKKMS